MPYMQILGDTQYAFYAVCADCDEDLEILNIRVDEDYPNIVEVQVYPCKECVPDMVWVVSTGDRAVCVCTDRRHAIAVAEQYWPEHKHQGRWYLPDAMDETYLVYYPFPGSEDDPITLTKVKYEG